MKGTQKKKKEYGFYVRPTKKQTRTVKYELSEGHESDST